MSYEPGTITETRSFGRSLKDYLGGVSLARSSINEKLLGFLAGVRGDVLDFGGYCDFQEYIKSGKHLITDLLDAPQNTLTADGRSLPFVDGSLGGVLCLSVLEHSQEPWKIVAEISRCLRPSGMAFISVPWMFEAHMEPYDYWRFSSSMLQGLAAKYSLTVEFMEPANGYFGAIAHLLQKRTVPRVLLGSSFWLLENLSTNKTDYRWASQINCFFRKPAAPNTPEEALPSWPNSLRCPRCVNGGGGNLKLNTDDAVCESCHTRYKMMDRKRLNFVDADVQP